MMLVVVWVKKNQDGGGDWPVGLVCWPVLECHNEGRVGGKLEGLWPDGVSLPLPYFVIF